MSSCHTSQPLDTQVVWQAPKLKNVTPESRDKLTSGGHAESLSSEYLKGLLILPDGLLIKWGGKTGPVQLSWKQNLGTQPEDWLGLASCDKYPLGLASSTLLWGTHLENMSNSFPPPHCPGDQTALFWLQSFVQLWSIIPTQHVRGCSVLCGSILSASNGNQLEANPKLVLWEVTQPHSGKCHLYSVPLWWAGLVSAHWKTIWFYVFFPDEDRRDSHRHRAERAIPQYRIHSHRVCHVWRRSQWSCHRARDNLWVVGCGATGNTTTKTCTNVWDSESKTPALIKTSQEWLKKMYILLRERIVFLLSWAVKRSLDVITKL